MPWAVTKNLCLEAVRTRTPGKVSFRLLSMPELGSCSSAGDGGLQGWRQGLGAKVHSQVSPFCRYHSIALKAEHLDSFHWFCAASWGGQWVKADTVSVPMVPSVRQRRKEIKQSQCDGYYTPKTGFHLCFLFVVVAVFGLSCGILVL